MDTENINWRGGIFLVVYHLLLFVSLPIYLAYRTPSLGLVAVSFCLYVVAALGITAGYHRLYSHRSFKASGLFEYPVLAAGTLATQGSVLEWAHDHRLHHRYVDEEKDPYKTRKGFWYSHLLWMFTKRIEFKERIISDLLSRKVLVFQHQYYGLLLTFLNAIVFFAVGWYFQDYWGALVLALLARMFLVHHCTWFINSLAHMWGSKPYSTEHSAVNNWILAILTMGEGYHNYHHTFAGDYRNGIKWYQYDITKLVIWTASKFGLTSDLRTVRRSTIQKKLILMDRQLMLERIGEASEGLSDLEDKIISLSDSLVDDLKNQEIIKRKLDRITSEKSNHLEAEFRSIKERFERTSNEWARLCKQVLTLNQLRVN